LNDLATAVSAAEEANKIAKQSFGSKIHILVNNAGASVPEYKLTKQNVEANVE
jgi:short-subunit dehydrogenase